MEGRIAVKPEFDRIDRRGFIKTTAAAATAAAAPQWLVSPAAAAPIGGVVALRRCAKYQRELIYDTLGQMFSDLGGLSSLAGGKKIAMKINGVAFGSFDHGLHSMFAHTTHPYVTHAVCRHLLEAGAARINIMESYNSDDTIANIVAALGYDQAEFEAMGDGSQVRFYSTRNKEMDEANPQNGFDAYTRIDTASTGIGAGAPYMFDYFYVNNLWAAPKADVIVSVGKIKSHQVAGVSLSIKNMFGCLPNSIYGGTSPSDFSTGPNEAETLARGNACHLALWTPVGEKAGHGIAPFDSERMPRLLADLCRALPIRLAVIDGICGIQGEMSPKNFTAITTPGLLAAGFNAVSVDSVCCAAMGGDPKAKPGTGLFPSGQNHIALAASKFVGSNDLSTISVKGDSIASVRYDFYPCLNRAADNPVL